MISQRLELEIKLIDSVPRSSYFCKQSFIIHIYSKIQEIETLFFLIIRAEMSLGNTNNLQSELQDQIQSEFFKLKRHFHAYFGAQTETEIDLFENLNSYFAMIDLYKFMMKCHNGFLTFNEKKRQLQNVYNIFKDTNNHLELFLDYFLNHKNIGHYSLSMMELKEEQEKKTRSKNPLSWANILCTHVLLLKLIDQNLRHVTLLEQAMDIYEKFNNPREKLLADCHPNSEVRDLFDPVQDFSKNMNKNLNVTSLLTLNPDLAKLVRSGIESVKFHDSIEMF